MSEYSEYMKQAKSEVNSCLSIWKSIFEENYSKSIDFAYVKGSAIKEWKTYIDYVPILSDVDIHIKAKAHAKFFDDESSFHESVNLSEMYENMFIEQNPNYFHIPRTQILNLKTLIDAVDFVYPKKTSVVPLINDPIFEENPSIETIKKIDLKNLLQLDEFLQTLPLHMIDRTGLDLWTMIRRLNWRVSPSPVRLLSLEDDDPLSIWELNRTSITNLLEKRDFYLISETYKDYYYEGWISFIEDFTNSQSLRRIISTGFEVLKMCLEEAKKINNNQFF